MTGHVCNYYSAAAGDCSQPATRRYLVGWRCPTHTPAALAGHPENQPDPTLNVQGLRAAAGLPSAPPPMSASRVVDDRAIASGKRRSTPSRYREAQTRIHGRTPA